MTTQSAIEEIEKRIEELNEVVEKAPNSPIVDAIGLCTSELKWVLTLLK